MVVLLGRAQLQETIHEWALTLNEGKCMPLLLVN